MYTSPSTPYGEQSNYQLRIVYKNEKIKILKATPFLPLCIEYGMMSDKTWIYWICIGRLLFKHIILQWNTDHLSIQILRKKCFMNSLLLIKIYTRTLYNNMKDKNWAGICLVYTYNNTPHIKMILCVQCIQTIYIFSNIIYFLYKVF